MTTDNTTTNPDYDDYQNAVLALQASLYTAACYARKATGEDTMPIALVLGPDLETAMIPLFEIPNDYWRGVIVETIKAIDGRAVILLAETWFTTNPALAAARMAGTIDSVAPMIDGAEQPLDTVREAVLVSGETCAGWHSKWFGEVKDGVVAETPDKEIFDDMTGQATGRLVGFWRDLERPGLSVE